METLKLYAKSDVNDVFAYGYWVGIHGLTPDYSKALSVDGYQLKVKHYLELITQFEEAIKNKKKPLAECLRDEIFSNIPKESPVRDKLTKQVRTMGTTN